MATIKIYSTPTCVYCRMTKEFLDERSVPYTDYNVAQDASRRDEMIERSGQMGVPVIDIDGKLIVGFDKARLMELLEIKN